jgi:RNA polymerase sigma factor (sigma-70 family)
MTKLENIAIPITDMTIRHRSHCSIHGGSIHGSAVHGNEDEKLFELFKQAVLYRSSIAWEKLYNHYLPLVIRWVRSKSVYWASGESAADFANRAFEKFWHALTPTKFSAFTDLRALLQYLRLCVHSVVIDYVRSLQHSQTRRNDELTDAVVDNNSLEHQYCSKLEKCDFWRRVEARLKNPKEAQLIYCRYVLGLKPSRICEQHPEIFKNTGEIYVLLQNILDRLRRDPGLQGFV